MTLQTVDIATGPTPERSLIMLHGLGADASDFLPLVQELSLDGLGAVRFVFPNAPARPVTINGGYVMRAWYDIVQTDLGRQQDEAGLRASQRDIESLIAREVAAGVPASRIVLAGFSQGCAMTLLTGLRCREALAGLAGLSGYLPLADRTAAERSAASAEVPIFLAHGRHDTIVTIDRAEASHAMLQRLGYRVEWHEYPMGHEVCAEEIRAFNDWLLRVWQ